MKSMSGRCLCGSVRFVAEEPESAFEACHCGMCRRWTGGPLFTVKTKSVAFEEKEALARYASSAWAERGFCKLCGSTLFYYFKPTKTFWMSVGAFDDTDAFRLVREIFIDRKPEGYSLTGDHPRLTEAEVLATLANIQG